MKGEWELKSVSVNFQMAYRTSMEVEKPSVFNWA